MEKVAKLLERFYEFQCTNGQENGSKFSNLKWTFQYQSQNPCEQSQTSFEKK